MTFDIPENASTEEKLLQLTDALEGIKVILGNLIEDMDEADLDTEALDDAMEAIDDAIDSIGDAVDELEEEEYELDEANENDIGGPDAVSIGIVRGSDH